MSDHSSNSLGRLESFVERLERLAQDKADVAADIGEVLHEAKGEGFNVKALRRLIRKRAMKPHDRAEDEALDDIYEVALGMRSESQLERLVSAMNVDITSREAVIEALSQMVPASGSITVDAGGKPVKLTRDASGEVIVREVDDRPAAGVGGSRGGPKPAAPRAPRADAPEVDDAGAEALGGEAFKANVPVIKNPFPFGHEHRPRWDTGWRAASGSDGLGKE